MTRPRGPEESQVHDDQSNTLTDELIMLAKICDRLDHLIELTEKAYKMFDNPAGRFLAKRGGAKNGQGIHLGGTKPSRG